MAKQITTIELNSIKAHLQEGSNPDGSRKFTVKTPLGIYVFKSKKEARTFRELYNSATKYYPIE